jgi:hypothetical protein
MQRETAIYVQTGERVKIVGQMMPSIKNNLLVQKSDGTVLDVRYDELKLDSINIDAVLYPKDNDPCSQKYTGQTVTIIKPVEDYNALGITPDKPAFFIQCKDGHNAVAFYDELEIDGKLLSQDTNLYYCIEPRTWLGRTLTFAPGPEYVFNHENDGMQSHIRNIMQTLGVNPNDEVIEGGFACPDNVSEDDVENAIRTAGFTPRDLSLLDRGYMFYCLGIGG